MENTGAAVGRPSVTSSSYNASRLAVRLSGRIWMPGTSSRKPKKRSARRRRSSVARDQTAERFADEVLARMDALRERRVRFEALEPGVLLAPAQLVEPVSRGARALPRVARVDPERAPVSRQLIDVKERKTVRGEDPLGAEQREVGKMLVIDGVELALIHGILTTATVLVISTTGPSAFHSPTETGR